MLRQSPFFIWASPCEKMSLGICGQRRPRSVCASAQSYLNLYCPLTGSLDTLEYINGEQRYGWFCACAVLSMRILRNFEWTFSLYEGHMLSRGKCSVSYMSHNCSMQISELRNWYNQIHIKFSSSKWKIDKYSWPKTTDGKPFPKTVPTVTQT